MVWQAHQRRLDGPGWLRGRRAGQRPAPIRQAQGRLYARRCRRLGDDGDVSTLSGQCVQFLARCVHFSAECVQFRGQCVQCGRSERRGVSSCATGWFLRPCQIHRIRCRLQGWFGNAEDIWISGELPARCTRGEVCVSTAPALSGCGSDAAIRSPLRGHFHVGSIADSRSVCSVGIAPNIWDWENLPGLAVVCDEASAG